jgi:hypothetical protein
MDHNEIQFCEDAGHCICGNDCFAPPYRKTGIPVLDNLYETFEYGTDQEYLAAVREFIEVSKRLPDGGRMGHKYIERLYYIAYG